MRVLQLGSADDLSAERAWPASCADHRALRVAADQDVRDPTSRAEPFANPGLENDPNRELAARLKRLPTLLLKLSEACDARLCSRLRDCCVLRGPAAL